MKQATVSLVPLHPEDREKFILDNQEAFKFGAMQEFGLRDDHFEEDGEIISRKTIERCIDGKNAETYRIVQDGESVGGLILKIDPVTHHNELEILFVSPKAHSRGIGYGAWLEVERLHPETVVWETCTPYFEKRNIHFYINKCGFHAVKFWNKYLPEPDPVDEDENYPTDEDHPDDDGGEMFFFEKDMRKSIT